MDWKNCESCLLLSRFIRFEASFPTFEGLLQSSIVCNVLSKSELTVDIVILAIGSLDRKVAILIDKALSLLIEGGGSGVGPPLCK